MLNPAPIIIDNLKRVPNQCFITFTYLSGDGRYRLAFHTFYDKRKFLYLIDNLCNYIIAEMFLNEFEYVKTTLKNNGQYNHVFRQKDHQNE